MRIRHLLKCPKVTSDDTGWKIGDMAPRFCPVYMRTRPMRSGWRWRSLRAERLGVRYIVVALCRSGRGTQQALLLKEAASQSWSLIARYEQHASHPGIHLHPHCERSGIEVGGSGFDGLARIPAVESHHRRTSNLTDELFWIRALKFFGVKPPEGQLL